MLPAGALCVFASGAVADSAVVQGSRAAGLEACVAPTDDMRRNHMEYIKHQRVRTVHQGVRGSKFSLVGIPSQAAPPIGSVPAHEAPRVVMQVPEAEDGSNLRRFAPTARED